MLGGVHHAASMRSNHLPCGWHACRARHIAPQPRPHDGFRALHMNFAWSEQDQTGRGFAEFHKLRTKFRIGSDSHRAIHVQRLGHAGYQEKLHGIQVFDNIA